MTLWHRSLVDSYRFGIQKVGILQEDELDDDDISEPESLLGRSFGRLSAHHDGFGNAGTEDRFAVHIVTVINLTVQYAESAEVRHL